MYVIEYRYLVPPDREKEFIELQSKVADLYVRCGCSRYMILKPDCREVEWLELTFFLSREVHRECEAKLNETREIGELFAQFIELTGANESIEPITRTIAFCRESH